MEESEFAEGKVCYNKDDDTSIGPDIHDLSYIDEKLKNLLGHSQKAFEGEFSAEKLGPKFGGYGSFLPMYLSCPSIWSSSGEVSARQDSCLSSAQVAEKKLPTKQESSLSKLVNPTDWGTLRVRIKVGSDSMTRKKEMQLDSQETSNKSQSRILLIKTSSPYPGEPILLPLHENLRYLSKNTPESVLRGRQKHSDISMNDSASKLGNGEGLKKKKSESVGKRETLEESRRGNGADLEKKRQVNKDWTKDILPFSDLAKERHVRSSCKDVSVHHREVGRSKFTRAPFKANFDDFKGARNNLKQNVGPKVQSHGQDKMKIHYTTEKSSFEGKKKPEETRSNGKSASEESLRAGIRSAPTNKKSAPKDVHKVRDLRLERKDNPMDRLDRPSGDRANVSNLKAVRE